MKALALSVMLLVASASAQEAPADGFGWWGSVSLGVTETPLWAGSSLSLSAGRQVALRLGYDVSQEFTLGASPTSVNALSLSAGLRTWRGPLHFAAYAGPSVVWGLDQVNHAREGPSRQTYAVVGAALTGNAFVEVARGFGLGVEVSGNVNPEISTLGARLAVHVKFSRAR